VRSWNGGEPSAARRPAQARAGRGFR
jgi:hypothetical protein